MHLTTTEKWLDRYFDPSSRPSIATLQRWLRDGKIPAKKVGCTWFIDEHAWLSDGDDLVERALKAG